MGKRPLILLHGWTMRGEVFDDLAARLSDVAECQAPDMPGHSSAGDRTPSLDECAKVAWECIAACSGGPAPVLLGWSMGAAAAWRYVVRFGTGGLAGLVTVDMSPMIVPRDGWAHGLRGQCEADVAASTRRIENDWDGVIGGIAGNMFADRSGPPGFPAEKALGLIRSHDPVAMAALWHELVTLDERQTIAKIDIPYLVCSGAQSRVYPASASAWLERTAPQARQQVFATSGHSPHLEEPEAFADALRGFIASLDG